MSRSIVLAFDVAASPARVYDILTTTQGQSAFWTGDCEVQAGHARFGFPGEPLIEADITTQPEQLVRMHATSGISAVTWEYELHPADGGTTVVFREYGFPADYSDIDLGRTAQTWAQIMDRLASYVATGTPQPYFPGHDGSRPRGAGDSHRGPGGGGLARPDRAWPDQPLAR